VVYALISTIPLREKLVVRDLLDCIYPNDESVRLVSTPLTGYAIIAISSTSALEECLKLEYFSKLIKGVQLFEEAFEGAEGALEYLRSRCGRFSIVCSAKGPRKDLCNTFYQYSDYGAECKAQIFVIGHIVLLRTGDNLKFENTLENT